MSDNKPVLLGRVSGLYGVKGWVKIHSFTDPREALLDYDGWLIEQGGNWKKIALAEGKRHGKTVIARFSGIEDRDAAAELVNCDLGVPRQSLPAAGAGEHYWTDLEGLRVERTDGTSLGTVAHLLETGANDVLVVQGDQEILIPYLKGDVIKNVDLESGVISVEWDWD